MRNRKTSGEKDTRRFGERIAALLKPGDIIALEGALGTGKTALVKGIAKGLGIHEQITSPTFTIVHSYQGERLTLHHFDVYRVHDEEELFNIGLEEYLYGEDICIIEWADLIRSMIPRRAIEIQLERTYEGDNERMITIKGLDLG